MSRIELAAPCPAPEPVALDGVHLSLADLVRVAREGAPVLLTEAAALRVADACDRLDAMARSGARLYGVHTGVGALERERAPAHRENGGRASPLAAARQASLLRSHAAGVGPPMRDDQVRAMMAVRASQLAAGKSGVSPATLGALVALLNRGVVPVVPELGSVGASDLAPLAHAALTLIGEGSARAAGAVQPSRAALAAVGLQPIELGGRDALALINGLGQTVATGSLGLWDARRLVAAAEAVSALTLCAMGAPGDFLDPHLGREKRHCGQEESSRAMRELVGAAASAAPADSPATLLRAPLSLRYAPQVLGAARTALELAGRVLDAELDTAVDNPFLDLDGFSTSNSPLTSGQEMGQALDLLASSLTSVAVASERRVAALLDERMSGLPGFLRHPRSRPGADCGFMIAQYTCAALVAEMRARGGSASVQSVPTCAGVEDHVSMCAIAARHAAWTVERAETVVAIELLCAAQAADLAGRALPPRLGSLVHALRSRVPVQIEDRLLADDIQAALAAVREVSFAA